MKGCLFHDQKNEANNFLDSDESDSQINDDHEDERQIDMKKNFDKKTLFPNNFQLLIKFQLFYSRKTTFLSLIIIFY